MSVTAFALPQPDPRVDAELQVLLDIRDRHEPALAEVYRSHAGAVYALAKRILSDPQRAEDVVQDVFVRLWDQPSRFDPERGSLRTFLLVQARSRSLDLLRSDKARRTREGAQGRLLAAALRDDGPETVVAAHAEVGEMRAAIQVLPEEQRQVIELAFFGGYTCRQLSELLDLPEGTVKSRIRLGLQRMRLAMPDGARR